MKKTGLLVVSIIVIIGSVWAILGRHYQPTQKVRLPEFSALGKVAAEEVRKVMPAGGRVVLVVCEVPVGMVGMEVAVGSFQSALTPMTTERITIKNLAEGANATQELKALLEKHAAVDVVVTIGGAGFLDESALVNSSQSVPRLVPVLSFLPLQLKALLAAQRVPLGIMPNFHAVPPTNPPQTPREWFDSVFVVVTPETPVAAFE